jgi:hypothetical protein
LGMREPRTIEGHPPIGLVFESTRFEEPTEVGVAKEFQEIGWRDFPEGGYDLSVTHGIQRVKILETAPTNGDAGIARHFEASPGEVYRLTARVRITEQTGQFKARINIAARKARGRQLEEFNNRLEEITDEPVERSVEATMPSGSEQFTARVKFHTSEPGDSGEGEIHAVMLERLR